MDPAKAKSRAIYKHDGAYYAVALDRKRERLYAGSTDYAIHVFDVPRDQSPAKDTPSKNDAEKKDAKAADTKSTDTKSTDTKAKDTQPNGGKAPAAKFEPIA